MGDLNEAEAPLVRVHAASLAGDVLENLRAEGETLLHQSMARSGRKARARSCIFRRMRGVSA